MAGATGTRVEIHDGIIKWFSGPEWDEVVFKVFQENAPRVQNAAQQNAPWADRTGMARNGLRAQATKGPDGIELTLYHTVDYGKWLETIQNGAFAIIQSTLEENAAVIFNEAIKACQKARRGSS